MKILNGEGDNEEGGAKKQEVVNIDNDEYDDEDDVDTRTFAEKIIISSENDVKGAFDVIILFFVGYSCFTTLYYVAFGLPSDKYHLLWD